MKNLTIFLILFFNSFYRKLSLDEIETGCLSNQINYINLENFNIESNGLKINSVYYTFIVLVPKNKEENKEENKEKCFIKITDNDENLKNDKNNYFDYMNDKKLKYENFNIIKLDCKDSNSKSKNYIILPKEVEICKKISGKDNGNNNYKPQDYGNNSYNSQDYGNDNNNSQDYGNNNYKPQDYGNNSYNSQDYGNDNNNSQDYGNNNYKPKEKKSFLKHYYPDGKGRDAELIEMIEQNIIIPDFQVKFSDIAGHEKAKEILKENVILPLKLRNFFKGIRKPSKGILLYGPPGTGKTMLAKAIATTGKTTFFNVNPSTLASKFAGESEKLVKLLFEMAHFYAPTTIFIDEIDSLLSQRGSMEQSYDRKVKTQFFVEIDGVQKKSKTDNKDKNIPKNVIVLAATNMPWELDEAILRRLSKRIYIPLPDKNARNLLFKLKMKGVNFSKNIDLDYLVNHTQGYNADDIGNICKEAAMSPLRNYLKKNGLDNYEALKKNEQKLINEEISNEVMVKALKNVKSSASEKFLERYKEWTKNYSST